MKLEEENLSQKVPWRKSGLKADDKYKNEIGEEDETETLSVREKRREATHEKTRCMRGIYGRGIAMVSRSTKWTG